MTSYFERAQVFIWNNARLIDRRRFACLFAEGSPQAVYHALKPYQNPDGGFGNALEPDKRAPQSQPIDVDSAFKILDEAGLLDDAQVQGEMVFPACDFLMTINTEEGGVPFSLPSANDYPHAPWWTCAERPPAHINPTAEIAGLLQKHDIRHPWLEKAIDFCWKDILHNETQAYHDLMPMIAFLEHTPDWERAAAELQRIVKRIEASGAVEMDPLAKGYVKMPLDWAPHPRSFCRKLFDEATLGRHLQALVNRQQADGGWSITWDPISPAVEVEWRGAITIEALRTLKAYENEGFEIPAQG